MPPKPKFSRDEIIDAALDVARERSLEEITAQTMSDHLETSASPVFTYFSTLEDLRKAVSERAFEIYSGYEKRGLSMTPPFRGLVLEYMHFAMDEPSLFRILFMRKGKDMDIHARLKEEGQSSAVLTDISERFRISQEEGAWLYENLWLYAHGVGTMCAAGAIRFSEEEIAKRLDVLCRGLLMALRAMGDEKTLMVGQGTRTMEGSGKDQEEVPPIPPYLF